MRDSGGMRCAIALLVQPFVRDPVTRHRDVASHLNRSRLEFNNFERQARAGLGGNPICYVVFANRRCTNRRPAKEIFVPKTQMSG